MTGRRQERLAEQIKEEVSMIIAGEVEDPRVGYVTVTDARLTPDLKYAKIYVSVLGTEEEINASLAALKHAAGFIRTQLGAVLRMKRTPSRPWLRGSGAELSTGAPSSRGRGRPRPSRSRRAFPARCRVRD